MIKTTNYEISKKLREIGFKAKAEKCWAKIRNSVLSEFHLVNLDYAVPQNCDEWVLSYDLETLLDALPSSIINYNYKLQLKSSEIGYYSYDDDNTFCPYGFNKEENESLADTAGRLIIWLHEKNLIKF